MSLRKSPTPPPEHAPKLFFAETLNLFPLQKAVGGKREAAGRIGSSAHGPIDPSRSTEAVLNGQMIPWFEGPIVTPCHHVLENKRG
jgi:hypothetical protein